jgi:chromate transport protein ChrA
MNEISSRIITTGLALLLGIALVFLSAFLLRFLHQPWVVLILSLLGAIIIGMVIKKAGAKSG